MMLEYTGTGFLALPAAAPGFVAACRMQCYPVRVTMMRLRGRPRIQFFLLWMLPLAPLFFIQYFPSQDGPNHLYNAVLFKNLADHANFMIRSFFQVNATVFPNWMYFLIVTPLLSVFSPIVADRIFLALCVGAFPLCFWYFQRASCGKPNVFVLLGFLFSYNYLLMMGFFNFALGCSLLFVALGFWISRRDILTPARIGALNVLLILLYLCHITPLLLFFLSVAVLTLSRSIRRILAYRGTAHLREEMARQGRHATQTACVLLPMGLLLVLEVLKHSAAPTYRSWQWLFEYFTDFRSLSTFSPVPVLWLRGLLLVLLCAVIVTAWRRLRGPAFKDDTADFGWLGLITAALYIYLPWGYGAGGWLSGGWINDRLHFLLFPLLSPWFKTEEPPWLKRALGACLMVILFANIGRTVYDFQRVDPQIADIVSLCRGIPSHSSLGVAGRSRAIGLNDFFTPFRYAAAYCAAEQSDIVFVSNYEAVVDFFPIRWRRPFEDQPDYQLILEDRTPPPGYDLVAQGRSSSLWKRHEAPVADLPHWSTASNGSISLGMDFEPQPGATASGFYSVGPNLKFHPGGYGWLQELGNTTAVAQGQNPGASRVELLLNDFLGSSDDGVFIVSLPNGRYEVSDFFFSGDSGGHRIGLIANGIRVIEPFELPAGQYTRRTFQVDVTDRKLIQVIYSAARQSRGGTVHGHWVWSGFAVRSLVQPPQ